MPVVSTRRVPLEYCAQVGRLLKAGAKSESLWHGRCAQPHTHPYISMYTSIYVYISIWRGLFRRARMLPEWSVCFLFATYKYRTVFIIGMTVLGIHGAPALASLPGSPYPPGPRPTPLRWGTRSTRTGVLGVLAPGYPQYSHRGTRSSRDANARARHGGPCLPEPL